MSRQNDSPWWWAIPLAIAAAALVAWQAYLDAISILFGDDEA